jgi:hypothetical protein
MGRFVSATGQFLLATYEQFSRPPTGSSRCPLTHAHSGGGAQRDGSTANARTVAGISAHRPLLLSDDLEWSDDTSTPFQPLSQRNEAPVLT